MKRACGLTSEQQFFLKALRDYVHETPTSMPDGVDTAALTELCTAQQLAPVLYYQTKLPELLSAFSGATYHAANRRKLLERIHTAFTGNGIPYLVCKGPDVALYHPQPYLRTSGDLDILVHAADKIRAGEALESVGFHTETRKSYDQEWIYEKGCFEIELHHDLLYDDATNEKQLVTFGRSVWEHASALEGTRFRIEPEFHLVYLLLHLRKHLLSAGVGIRPFLDIGLMLKNGGLDEEKIQGYIGECGITRFASVCFALVERWFGIRSPAGAAVLTEDIYLADTRSVLENGLFGDHSYENILNNGITNTVRKYGKASAALSYIFPDRAHMVARYPELERHKILMPVFWIRRLAEILFKQSAERGINYPEKFLTMGKLEKERKETLDSWGL